MIVDEMYKLNDDTAKRDNAAWNSVHAILYGLSDNSTDNCNISNCEGGGCNG